MAKITYEKNEKLKTILPDWKGNPMANGRFIDMNKRFSNSLQKFLKWQFSKNVKAEEKRADTFSLKVRKGNAFLSQKNDVIVWLGHASFFLQLNGVRILIDPVFGRISGVVPRYSEMPCATNDFT